MFKKISFIFSILLVYAMNLCADYCFPTDLTADMNTSLVGANQFYIEPRFAYFELNTIEKESGWIYGIKAAYDFISLELPYIGLEASYMQGDVKEDSIKNDYQDFFVEAKLGYQVCQLGIYLIPFVGLAYENEHFNSLALQLQSVKNQIHYGYLSLGFLSRYSPFIGMSIGLNFKAKYLFLANYKNKGEANHNCTLSNRFHYTLELPASWQVSNQMQLALVPFYEYKVYCLNIGDLDWINEIKIQDFGLGFRLNYLF